jgi:hypothetical protein
MTFKEWMEAARKTLRETPREGEHEVMDALLNDFATNPPRMKNGEAESESEVCGRLREYCEGMRSEGSTDLDEAYNRITGLRVELAKLVLERDQWKTHAEDRDRGFEMEVRRRQTAEADRDALRVSYRAELEGSAKLREKYGAREDETFAAFVERLAAECDVYADEARCLRKRLAGMADVLGVSIDDVVGAVNGAINERAELREACEHERQMSKALASKLHESRTLLAQSQNESDGRRRSLLELEAERHKDWQRAENAEAAPRCSGGSCFGGVRDQLSEAIGSLMGVCVGNPTVKGLPEIVDDLRRVRDMLAMMAGEPRLAR